MRPIATAAGALLLALTGLAAAQPQPTPGASIGTESVRAPAPNQNDFPIFSAAAVGSQKLEAETCVIRPVMTDVQLKLCGATPPVYPEKKLVTDMIK